MTRFVKWKKPIIKHLELTSWGWLVSHPESLKIGDKVDIGAFTYINAYYGVEIEDSVQIGGGCKIYSLDTISNKCGKIVLKKGCSIGANSVILGGVTVGRRATVAALSFVNQNIPAGELWGGIPARKIR